MRSASSRPIARPRPKPALRRGGATTVEALEDVLALLGRDPGPVVGDRDARAAVAQRRIDHDRLAGRPVPKRVVEQDPHDARDGVGVAAAPAPVSGRVDLELDVPLTGAQLELGGDRAHELAELHRLGPQLHGRVKPAEIEQLAGERGQPAQLAAGVDDLELGVLDVHGAVAQVLVQQLHRPLEHRQRRPQLVRGGGDERAPRGLLAAQLLLHARERDREVADLVATPVPRRGGVGPLLGDPQGGGAQAREPA